MIKIKWQQGLIIASFSAITACGGGGGGGGAQSSAAAMSSASSMLSSSSQSSVINLSPLAKIQFPRQDSRPLTGYNTIEVSGVAYDDKGIKSVKVNGVAASLNQYPEVTQGSDMPATHPHKTTWSATINLQSGDTRIIIEVTDTDGLVLQDAASPLTIRNAYTPMGTLIDNINDHMIGSIQNGHRVATNLQTLDSVILPFTNYGYGESFNHDVTKVYLTKMTDGFLKVYSSNIATGIDSLVANYDLKLDPEKHAWASVLSGTLSSDSMFYFVAILYSYNSPVDGEQYVTNLLKVNTSDGSISLLNLSEPNSKYKNVSQLFYANDHLYGFNMDDYVNSELVQIDIQTGERTLFLSLPRFEKFELNSDRSILYGISYEKFVAINLADKAVASKSFPAQGYNFDFYQSPYFLVDEKRNRLIASGAGSSDVIAIDITSGERSLLIRNGIGDGAGLVIPDQLEITADNKFAYVFDSRLMAADLLFKIDLMTGNRTAITDFSNYSHSGTSGLVLDEENNRVFFAVGLTVGTVDLSTGLQEVIASQNVGLGITMESLGVIDEIIYDQDNNRILVSSSVKGFIMAIDVDTQKRTLAFDSITGNGPMLKGIAGMALNREAKKLYVSNIGDDGSDSILSIDLATGDRALVLDKCADKNGIFHPVVSSMRTALEWDSRSSQLFVINQNEILVQDIANNKCGIINTPVDDIAILSDATLIGLSAGLVQINPHSGERAIISK